MLLFVSITIFSIRLYHKILKYKKNIDKTMSRRDVKITFFTVIIMNFFFNLAVFFIQNATTTEPLRVVTRSLLNSYLGGNMANAHKIFSVDSFSTVSATMMSIIAMISMFMALIARKNVLSPTKTAFFILTTCGLTGTFYSNTLFALFFFILITQVGVAGLYRGIPAKPTEIRESWIFYFTRIVILLIFLIGLILLRDIYGTDNIHILSSLLKPGFYEQIAYVCLIVPSLFIFFKHTLYIRDEACRCYFRLVAQGSLFVVFKVVFMLYGPMSGLEKIPNVFLILGIIGLALSTFIAPYHSDPELFSEDIELYLKSTLLIVLGISMRSLYSAKAMVKFGIVASEAMISVWMLYLPLSVMFTILCIIFKRKEGKYELWKYGAVATEHPITAVMALIAVFSIAGLPPFSGYMARQFLYRAVNNFQPVLMVFVFCMSFFMLVTNIKFFSSTLFIKKMDKDVNERKMHMNTIAIPLFLIIVLFFMTSIFPGLVFENYLSPAAKVLLNREHIVNLNTEINQNDL